MQQNRKTVFKYLLIILVLWIALLRPSLAYAYLPFSTNYKDGYDQLVWTQSAYNPVAAWGREIYISDPKKPDVNILSPLKQPQDVFIDSKDHLYIADTGNNRLVHLDNNGKLIRILDVRESPLNKPQGLYIDGSGDIYVADTGNKRVVRLNADGKLIQEYKRPESKFLPQSFKYDPVKLVVDKRGFLYVTCLGSYQGLVVLDPQGKFQGFFGANVTSFSLVDAFKRLIYTREMYQREISKLPGTIASVAIDQDGQIYTASKEVETGQIKKLNIAGKDQLATRGDYADPEKGTAFGEFAFVNSPIHAESQLSDLTVDRDGNITAIDSKLKVINQYDSNGNLLFFWWGDDKTVTTKLGLVKTPTAVANNSRNELFILDGEGNMVQVFKLSEFGKLVHQANHLTQDGRYEESEPYWAEVHRLNAYYTPAILGLAKAAYKRGDYEKAQSLFLEAGQPQGYSDSLWQNRLLWFQKHFGTLVNTAIVAFILWLLFEKWSRFSGWRERRRKRKCTGHRLWQQLKHAFYVLRHPIDGFSAIRYENKGSMASSFILLLLALVSYCVMRAGISFQFNPEVILEIDMATVIIQFLSVWLAWVVSNYLICTIYRGEGRFRDVLYGSSYALFPLVLIGLPITLLSNVMTLNEISIYKFIYFGLFAWILLLIFWMVMSMQNYSVGETGINVLLSVFTMAICCVLLFITFGLTKELSDFVYSVYQEVSIR